MTEKNKLDMIIKEATPFTKELPQYLLEENVKQH
jgi:hypothetical protein